MFRPPAAGIAEPGASVDMRVQREFQAERQMVRKTTRGRTAVEGTRRTTGIEQPAVDHREAVACGVAQSHPIEQPRPEQQVARGRRRGRWTVLGHNSSELTDGSAQECPTPPTVQP